MLKKLLSGLIFSLVMMMAVCGFAQTFNTSDLEGTWYAYLSETNPAVGTYWVYGNFTVNNSGGIIGGSYTATDGTTVSVTGGQMSVDNNGIITGTITAEGGVTGTFPNGKLDQSKTIASFVGTDTNGSLDLGVAIKLVADPTYDATGEWDFSTSNTWASGGPNCNPEDPNTGTVTVTQTGNNVTLVSHDDEGDTTFTGSVSGDIYSLTASFPEEGGTMTINVVFTLSSNTSGTGEVTYSWTDGVETCNGRFDITFTKQAVQPGDGGGGGCFIATAAYGSSMEPHVNILRDFRDRFLLHNSVGKDFMRLYYTYSPPMADFIAKHDSLRAFVRVSLLPVVGVSWIALKIGPVFTVALMLLFISCFVGLIWNRRRYKE